MRRLALGVCALLACGAAFLQASPAPSLAAFERYSVLTPPGPDEPSPEVLAKSRRLLWTEHRVRKGEYWAGTIAKNYGTTLTALQATNNDEFALLYPGARMIVHNRDGQLYQVRKSSESLDAIVARFKFGAEERRKFKEVIVRVNELPGIALLAPYDLDYGDRLLIPGVRMSFDTYRFPFESASLPRISSRFGYRFHPVRKSRKFHEGLDIPKPYGTPVYAARTGRVLEAGWHEGYGQLIVIKHDNGETTRYGHLSRIMVKPGDLVQRAKTIIGRVGSTGISTGPHLHFEVRNRNGSAVDPRKKIGKR